MSIIKTRTFAGAPIEMIVRDDTGDSDIVRVVIDQDEYGLEGRVLEGIAFDIGAHIGSVAIPLAIDNPGLQVVALEPVPENAEVLRQNIEANKLDGRVIVDSRALYTSVVRYGWRGDHNYWVGNLNEGGPDANVHSVVVPEMTFGALLDDYEVERAALVKIDCEGCEWPFFDDLAVGDCDLIVGEFHNDDNERGRIRLLGMLLPTHEVTVDRWTFTATAR